MKVIFCGFGNPDNRGCEAIIRTTTKMVKEILPKSNVIALCNDYGRVPMIPLDTIDRYCGSYYPHDGELLTKLGSALYKMAGSNELICVLENAKNYKEVGKADVCISVGGDNFCYSDRIDHFIVHHKHFQKQGAKLIHWGSSFEKSLMLKKLSSDLNRFDEIMVRESISYEALEGICDLNKVHVVPDPAFIMEPCKIIKMMTLLEKGCVGINISPMIIGKESQSGIVKCNAINLINYITNKGRQVILIPHVADRTNGTGDYSAMKDILKEIKYPERCMLIGFEYSAPEYKWIISKCNMFIGARTHSTIAAYSTCVPTVVLGYSVKARGIAKDIFGEESNYVLPVQKLKTEYDFINAYNWLEENNIMIKNVLSSKMPDYINEAKRAQDIILKCI